MLFRSRSPTTDPSSPDRSTEPPLPAASSARSCGDLDDLVASGAYSDDGDRSTSKFTKSIEVATGARWKVGQVACFAEVDEPTFVLLVNGDCAGEPIEIAGQIRASFTVVMRDDTCPRSPSVGLVTFTDATNRHDDA